MSGGLDPGLQGWFSPDGLTCNQIMISKIKSHWAQFLCSRMIDRIWCKGETKTMDLIEPVSWTRPLEVLALVRFQSIPKIDLIRSIKQTTTKKTQSDIKSYISTMVQLCSVSNSSISTYCKISDKPLRIHHRNPSNLPDHRTEPVSWHFWSGSDHSCLLVVGLLLILIIHIQTIQSQSFYPVMLTGLKKSNRFLTPGVEKTGNKSCETGPCG